MKNLIFNSLGLVCLKFLSLLSGLAIIPAYTQYFQGNTQFIGGWISLFAALMIAYNMDFGIGPRLKNDLINEINSRQKVNKTLTLGFNAEVGVTLIIVLAVSIIVFISCFFESKLFPSQINGSYLIYMTAIVISYFFINMPLRICVPILQANQHNAVAGMFVNAPFIILLLCVTFGNIFIEPERSLDYKVFSLLISFVFFSSIFNLLFFSYAKMQISLRDFLAGVNVKKIFNDFWVYFRVCKHFFIIQISLILIFYSNELFYFLKEAPELSLEYQYYYRLYSIFFVGFSLVSMPFWSALRRDIIRNDLKSVKKILLVLFVAFLILLVMLFIFSFVIQFVINAWVGEGVFLVSSSQNFLFIIFSILLCLLLLFSTVLNSFDKIKSQAAILSLGGILKVLFAFEIFAIPFHDVDEVLMSSILSGFAVVLLLFILTLNALKLIFKSHKP